MSEYSKLRSNNIKDVIVNVGEEDCFDGVEAFNENGEKINENESPLHYYDFNFKVDVDDGKIMNWPEKKISVNIYMRAKDTGIYTYYDKNGNSIFEESGYVPDFLGIESPAYGDDINFKTDTNGFILKWNEKEIKKQIVGHLEKCMLGNKLDE